MRHRLTSPRTDHPLAACDPRLKLLAGLGFLILVLCSRTLVFPLAALAGALFVSSRFGLRPTTLLLRFAQPLFLAVLLVLFKLFSAGGDPLFFLQFFGITLVASSTGLASGLLIAARLLAAVAVLVALSVATPFTELLAAFAWLRIPREIIEIAHFAWRALFLFYDDALVIYSAQRNRLGYAGWRRGLSSFGTLAGALVIKAFDNSQSLTVAMTQRGYDGTLPLYRHRPFRGREVALFLFLLVFAFALFLILQRGE